MIITHTGQVHLQASKSYFKTVIDLVSEINEELRISPMGNLELEISFCPIILPTDMVESFKGSTRYDKRKKIFYINEHLDFQAFQAAAPDMKRILLLESIREGVVYMKKFFPKADYSKALTDLLDKIR